MKLKLEFSIEIVFWFRTVDNSVGRFQGIEFSLPEMKMQTRDVSSFTDLSSYQPTKS